MIVKKKLRKGETERGRGGRNEDKKKDFKKKRYSASNNILRRTVTHLSLIVIKGI